MDIDRGRIINDFIEPNKKQYIIPVYQRNYEWSREQCVKLFEDIVQAYQKDKLHFCGSIVYAPLNSKHNIDYYVIVDGQQRLTTIYLLIKALIDCAETERERELLADSVFNRDKYDAYDVEEASKLKLKPIKSDNQQLYLLMDNKYDSIDKSSGIWTNYSIFVELIRDLLAKDHNMDVRKIYNGVEKLICAKIKLDGDDNAQEIFERINSTGVPLSLSDQIRNFVLMTDADQDRLYEEYWLRVEEDITKDNMSNFFLDYLNFRSDGFVRENQAYEAFKALFNQEQYSNENMLKELCHYARQYKTFLFGDPRYSNEINEYLEGLRLLNQTTVFLFLFGVFDDLEAGTISENELARVLRMLLNYSIRRLMCDISSNSLRGLYKTLYNRVFSQKEYKEHYYDSLVSFMLQMTSRDAIPSDDDFAYALKNNNLYRKHALCKYLLVGIENQGKEKLITDNLSIEHVMPQNKNLSTAWQKMLGENWAADKDRWLHTLGNLTLTGYNSELGDRPFLEKKKMIEENQTKVVNLYKDIQDKETWNADLIQKRADRLVAEVMKLYPIEQPSEMVVFTDPRYKEYTCAEPSNATYKIINYYELEGERVTIDSFANMVKSVAKKLYEKDPTVIEAMARSNETINDWGYPAFSFDVSAAKSGVKLGDTSIYISTGFSAADCIRFIRALIRKYDLDIEEDFVYSGRSNNNDADPEHKSDANTGNLRLEYWRYALPIIQEKNDAVNYLNCVPTKSNTVQGSFGVGGVSVNCIANYDQTRIDFWIASGSKEVNKAIFDELFSHKDEIEKQIGAELKWSRADDFKASWIIFYINDVNFTDKNTWERMASLHAEWSSKIGEAMIPYLAGKFGGEDPAKIRVINIVCKEAKRWTEAEESIIPCPDMTARSHIRFKTDYMSQLFPDTDGKSGWNNRSHYYYEIRNADGEKLFIQLAFNSQDMPEDQKRKVESICDSQLKENWVWKLAFTTTKHILDKNNLRESVNDVLNKCMRELEKFELGLREKGFHA